MPKVSQSYVDSRRKQILDAAILCFSRQGFHCSTMQDVVKQSRLSPGAIYNYFASKEEIIAAIASDRLEKERLLFQAACHEQSFAGAVIRLRDAFFSKLRNPKERLRRRLSIQLWAEAQRTPQILKVVRKSLDAPRKLLRDLLAAAQRRGEISKAIDSDAAARFLIAVFYGLVLQVEWDEKLQVRSQIQILENFLASIAANKSSKRASPPTALG